MSHTTIQVTLKKRLMGQVGLSELKRAWGV